MMAPERTAQLAASRARLSAELQAMRDNPPTSRRKPKDGSEPGPPKYWQKEVASIEKVIESIDRVIGPLLSKAKRPPAPKAEPVPPARPGAVIARIPKGKRAEMRVSINEWNGLRIVDVRLWFLPKAGGDWAASRKGVSVEAGKLDALVDALVMAKQHVAARL